MTGWDILYTIGSILALILTFTHIVNWWMIITGASPSVRDHENKIIAIVNHMNLRFDYSQCPVLVAKKIDKK